MNIEGNLEINLCRQDNQPSEVNIQSTRPLQAVKLFQGKSVQQLLELISLLYSVCGTAQAYTALSASQEAMGISINKSISNAQQLLVNLETTREHLWRILLDWPKFINETDQSSHVAARLTNLLPLSKQFLFVEGKAFSLDAQLNSDSAQYQDYIKGRIDEIEEILTGQIFAISTQEWLDSLQHTGLKNWLNHYNTIATRLIHHVFDMNWELSGKNSIQFLPELDKALLDQRFKQENIEQFIAQPSWDSQFYETTPLQRMQNHPILTQLQEQYSNGLLTRLVARLVELAELPRILHIQLEQIKGNDNILVPEHKGESYGLAQVEAARGRLVHWIKLKDGIVADFKILAPTEWNFHPNGVAAQGLQNIKADSDEALKTQAELWLNSIDPCVSYELNMS